MSGPALWPRAPIKPRQGPILPLSSRSITMRMANYAITKRQPSGRKGRALTPSPSSMSDAIFPKQSKCTVFPAEKPGKFSIIPLISWAGPTISLPNYRPNPQLLPVSGCRKTAPKRSLIDQAAHAKTGNNASHGQPFWARLIFGLWGNWDKSACPPAASRSDRARPNQKSFRILPLSGLNQQKRRMIPSLSTPCWMDQASQVPIALPCRAIKAWSWRSVPI